MRLLLAALLLLGLASCGERFNTDQQRQCRLAIPPLSDGQARITILEAGDGSRPNSLRLVFQAERAGASRTHTLDCLFAGEGAGLQRGALIGLALDGRPLSDASFYLIKRFHLDDTAAPPRDPAADDAGPVPTLAPDTAFALQLAIAALPSGAIYALLAASYALIYGLSGRIILCFGEFAALGAFAGTLGVALTLSLSGATPAAGLLVALFVALAVCALHGFAMGRAVLRPLGRESGQRVLIATIGLAIALSEYLRLAQGPELRWLPPVHAAPFAVARSGSFAVTATPVGLALAGLGFAATLGLVLLIARTAYGRAWRACADDARTAALFGVDARAVGDRALVIAACACGFAGFIVTVVHGGLGFAGGFALGLKALVAAVLGGIGSVPGAALGGLCIAAFEVLWSAAMPIEQRDIAVYSLLALVLILRPGGFFGEAELSPRPV